MASDASRSGASADSYIGSMISLTSKFEIRYEGVLYNINTEESSIGLRNVRSFGTEGRKKDGPQIPASDKIYEYILFRGSDIKDLQVKASPPAQTAPIYNDPAIIQSQYARPTSTPSSFPTIGSGTAADLSSQTANEGLLRPNFQGGLSLQQPGGSLGSWASPPPPAQNGSGLAMPFYWQGYYTPSGGLSHMQQPPLFRPPPGVPIPHPMQQPLQFPGSSASLPSGAPSFMELPTLLQPGANTPNLTSPLSSTLIPSQVSSSVPDATPIMPYKPPVTSIPPPTIGANPSPVPSRTSTLDAASTVSQKTPSAVSSKPNTVASPAMIYQTLSQSVPSIVGSSSTSRVETTVPLVTPGQLLQPSLSTLTSSLPLQTSVKDVEVKPPDTKIKSSLPEPSLLALPEDKGPLLPLPTSTDQKLNGAAIQTHPNNRGRGRGRGRGNGYPRNVTKFTEDFDFTAMNEKFNKDEVWGHLGKSKSQSRYGEEEGEVEDNLEFDEAESSKHDAKPVYVKEDFFDSLSSNALDRNGRPRFSEQMKVDTETFGEIQRNRFNRGGGRGYRGGGRMRGSYYGRGGYGYPGRGRDRPN